MNDKGIVKILQRHYKVSGSYREMAKCFGVTAPYVWDLMHGRRTAGKKILGPLGYKRVTVIKSRLEKVKP